MSFALIALAVVPASASAIHNDVTEDAEVINQPGTPLSSFNRSHTNLGDAFFNPGEFTACSGVEFGSSVWYRINPHRNGRFNAVVQGPNADLEPVVVVFRVDGTPEGNPSFPCNAGSPPLFRADLPAGGGFIPLTGGVPYFIQIGGGTVGGGPSPEGGGSDPATEGNYNLFFTYDPNTDGDALFDSEDRCDNQAGTPAFQGCLDTDGDGRADPDDRCPNARGPANFLGCPDTDRDRIPDIDDRCPRDSSSSRDPNRDGCLDLHALVDAKLNHRFYGGGIVISSLEILKVPRGSRVSVACRRGRRKCGSFLDKRATAATPGARIAKTVRPRKFRNKRLRYGTTLTIRVTKRGATGKYIRYKVVRGKKRFKRIDRCTNVGSKKLRKRRCK